jgi:16S rRNA processing protein RimM
MLKKEDFAYFGKFLKPHGTKGEIGLQTDTFALDEGFDFVACDIDGILVPFFFENVRSKGSDTLIVKVERLESAEEVRYLTNRDAYIPRKWIEECDEVSLGYFIGFTATDRTLGDIGEITDIDESTINTLFVVENNDEEILIPAQEEFIVDIDHENSRIILDLPEGLVEL